jgi:alpha/beta superfamily hydrolase
VSPTSAAAPRFADSEIPLFFTPGDRPMFAVYHAPKRERANAPVLVHAHSLGVEQVTLYRAEVSLAREAARRGFPVLRYHSRGHGDSAGDFADVTMDTLVADALAAADEAKRRSGATRIAWLGVRFGSLVAARVAAETNAMAIALWEPVHKAPEYFRGQLRAWLFSQVANGVKPNVTVDQMLATVESEGQYDVHGYYLHREIVRSSRDEDLAQRLENWRGPTFLAQVQQRGAMSPANAALMAKLENRGVKLESLRIAQEPGWYYVENPAWENATLTRRTAEWLDALA